MGTFIGHAAPGFFFIVFSLWWMIQYAYNSIALDNGKVKPQGRILRLLQRLPVEGIVITFFAVLGWIGEMSYPAPKWTMFDSDGEFKNAVEWQHVTMYTYFGIYGASKLLGGTVWPDVKYYEKPLGALAYFIEGLLFFYHTHGREHLDTLIHNLLVIAIWSCAFSAFLEVLRPKEKLFFHMRVLCTLWQGTWFWQIGFVLYLPPGGKEWDQESMGNSMLTTASFTWHLVMDMFILVVVYAITNMVLQVTGKAAVKYHRMDMDMDEEEIEIKLLNNGSRNKDGGSEEDET
ncbi:putative transmembrane protein [Apostichopus japonicus]|uniref:Putative transmembrane protein n=1 Tax=Stichopus japonicus TaxID=307972 RepID=A0A2G8JI84_STIJA|nr:putative transmembrane protein [Apostichopus japonicus]